MSDSFDSAFWLFLALGWGFTLVTILMSWWRVDHGLAEVRIARTDCEKYADRVTHVHVKDRKMNNGPNVPFGQGDTPIKEVLQFMKQKKYKFQATIEYEYSTPADSTVLTEISKCVEYCRKALV